MSMPIGLHSSLEELLEATEYAVEATDFEKFSLWKQHNEKVSSWTNRLGGYSITLGIIEGMPIVLSVVFEQIEDHLILFYTPTSQLVDWRMIEAWVEKLPVVIKKGGKLGATTDAGNFIHCFHELDIPKQKDPA